MQIQKRLDLRIDPEFEEWDELFRDCCSEDELALIYNNSQSGTASSSVMASAGVPPGNEYIENQRMMAAKTMDMKIAAELEAWDERFREQCLNSR